MKLCAENIIEPHTAEKTEGNRCVQVTVIIPCFNESEGIHDTMSQLLRAREICSPKYALQFLFVDDASTDDTIERIKTAIAAQTDFELVCHPANRGITGAIMTGINHARTDLVASLDADCTYDPARLIDLLEMLEGDTSASIAMITASPYHPLGAVENVPKWRLRISGSCSQLYRWVMRSSLYTYTSCFRLYRRTAFLGWEPRNTGFVGLVEMIRMLDERGGRIAECPAVLKVRRFGQSKMRIMRVASQHLRFISQTLGRRLLNRRDQTYTSQQTSPKPSFEKAS